MRPLVLCLTAALLAHASDVPEAEFAGAEEFPTVWIVLTLWFVASLVLGTIWALFAMTLSGDPRRSRARVFVPPASDLRSIPLRLRS